MPSSPEYLRAWRKANTDKIVAYRNATRERRNRQSRARGKSPELKERRAAVKAAWYAKNKERILSEKRAQRASRPGWNDAAVKRYLQRYPERHAERVNRRRSALQAERVDYALVLQKSRGLCGICGQPLGEIKIHFDHIVPLSRGGRHTQGNIQASHARCNRMKGARIMQ